jgi:hypothetical protein
LVALLSQERQNLDNDFLEPFMAAVAKIVFNKKTTAGILTQDLTPKKLQLTYKIVSRSTDPTLL